MVMLDLNTNSDTLRVVTRHCPMRPQTSETADCTCERNRIIAYEIRVFTAVSSLLFINYCDKLLRHITCQVLLPIFCMAIRF